MYKRIYELREDNDLKQREIAKILNCSQRVYSNYERGDLDIPTEILIKLAKYYDVSTDYILGISDKKKPNKQKKQSRQKKVARKSVRLQFCLFALMH